MAVTLPSTPPRFVRLAPRWTLVIATVLVSLVGLAAAQLPPVTIGLLLANTGFMSVIGQDATRGFELYLDKVSYRAGGRTLTVVKADTESKVDVGLTKVQRLVEQNHVDVVVGPELSPIALAIRDSSPSAATSPRPPRQAPGCSVSSRRRIRPTSRWGRGSIRRRPTGSS
ncbi:MAG: hypothetical protein DMD91_08195 [Candidatus Rokuibacteriota bacterium]|nr:MAG: hypothetical protein DMD91_08195 [Candidatus Rokubacteria bacterium]